MVCNSLTQELAPDDTNMRDYKINLCLSFFFKFYLQVLSRINETIPSRDRSAIKVNYLEYSIDTFNHVPVEITSPANQRCSRISTYS